MYRNNINLSLTILGLFLIENVLGAPGDSGLAKNHGELKSKIAHQTPQRVLNEY